MEFQVSHAPWSPDDDPECWCVYGSDGLSVACFKTEDDAQAEADKRNRAANEREQVAEVFGVTGGELMDVPWTLTVTREQFAYWYEGVPDFDDREFDVMLTYRTVCNQELYGMAPEQIMDDEGTWTVVARYRNSGEIECPYRNDDNPPVPTKEHPCPLCDADGSPAWQSPSATDAGEHGYIYIGDGWAEIVYRLQEPPEVHGELAIQEHVSERGQSYVDTGIPETTFTIEADATERSRALRMSCDAGPLAITLLAPRVGDEIARFYLRVWDLLYTADTGKPKTEAHQASPSPEGEYAEGDGSSCAVCGEPVQFILGMWEHEA